MTGAALGGYLSASSSSSLATSAGVSAVAGLTGGFLMAVGSRLASGCTRFVQRVSLLEEFAYHRPQPLN